MESNNLRRPSMQVGDIILLGRDDEDLFPLKSREDLFKVATSSKMIQNLQNLQKILSFNNLKRLLGFKSPQTSSFRTKYSHVAVCIDDGIFLEAKGPDQVIYSTYEEILAIPSETKSSKTKYIRCFRNKNLNRNNISLITERGLYHVGTPYSKIGKQLWNYFTTTSSNKFKPHTVADEFDSFCSDLLIQMFESIKDQNTDKPVLAIKENSKYVLPIHIEEFLIKDIDWINVDEEYKELQNMNNERAKAYKTLGSVHKTYYEAKTEALKVTNRFHTIKDYYLTIPLWFRMHIYHVLKAGNRGEVKEYLARQSLFYLLRREK